MKNEKKNPPSPAKPGRSKTLPLLRGMFIVPKELKGHGYTRS
jgi:hypothetical protein